MDSGRIRCPVCGMLPQPCHYERVHELEVLQAVGLGRGKGFRHIRHDKSRDLGHVLGLVVIVRRVLGRLESIAKSLGLSSDDSEKVEKVRPFVATGLRAAVLRLMRPAGVVVAIKGFKVKGVAS